MVGVEGAEWVGAEDWGWEALRAASASASERWFANVFRDIRIFRTLEETLPWLAVCR